MTCGVTPFSRSKNVWNERRCVAVISIVWSSGTNFGVFRCEQSVNLFQETCGEYVRVFYSVLLLFVISFSDYVTFKVICQRV